MAFPEKEVAELLAKCHRRCCICHRYCGVKMELDHMVPKAEGGPDTIDNAIPVCFECHAEIHAYNDKHPRGRKFKAEELRMHKEEWLKLCATSAHFLASVPSRTDVGPIQALIDELEFNVEVAATADQIPHLTTNAHFSTVQFNRAMSEGVLSLLEPQLKKDLMSAYTVMARANTQLDAIAPARSGDAHAHAMNHARERFKEAQPLIAVALQRLATVLGTEN
jgi:HNH endonuclease